jgi:hypothetical protein
MKIEKAPLVALLVALGFSKAATWSDEKLATKAEELPEKVKEDDIPEEHKELFDQIAEGDPEEPIEIFDTEPGEEVDEKPKKKGKKKGKSEKDKAGEALQAEADAAAEEDEEEEEEEEPAPANKGKKGKKETGLGEFRVPSEEKKEKPSAANKDYLGCKLGSISNKVNEVLSDEWIDENEVAKLAGVKLDQARGRLYYGTELGQFEVQRLVQYRLKPGTATKPTTKKAKSK